MSPITESTTGSPVGLTAKRYCFLDGLRGLAALGVLVHHLYHNSEFGGVFVELFPNWLSYGCVLGARGVQVFFVLSGFVIAYSVRDMPVNLANAANFAMRRQIRLDPAFWCCLTITVLDRYMAWAAHPTIVSKPTLVAFLSNCAYLQYILQQPAFVGVAWTLCLEVQFYLVFIILLWLGHRIFTMRARQAVPLLILVMTAGSFLVRLQLSSDSQTWFIGVWYLFGIGVLLQHCCQNPKYRPAILTLSLAVAIMGFVRNDTGMIVGGLTAIIIFVSVSRAALDRWLRNRLFQYFGRISYSLYLIHLLVLERIYKASLHVLGISRLSAMFSFIIAFIACLVAAEVLHRLIERPTMKLASKMKRARVTELVGQPCVAMASS